MNKLEAIKWDMRKFGIRGAAMRLARSFGYHAWLRISSSGAEEREFDERHGVETDGNMRRPALDLNPDSLGYYPSRPRLIKSLIKKLPIDPSEFTFIDIGCGKGRPLVVAHSMGFKALIGVEMSPALAEIARKNMEKTGAQIANCDAAEFPFPTEKLVVYMYNPFGKPTVEKFVRRLEQWVWFSKTKIYVIYVNPFWEQLLAESNQFNKVCGVENEYAIYESAANEE